MKLLKQHQFWISFLVGIVLFAGTYPFYHDMYIAELFTALCICLNAFSAILFSLFIYCKWTKLMDADGRTIFLWFTIMQAVGHGIFAMMNWGSFLFLALSVIVIILIAVSYFKEKKEWTKFQFRIDCKFSILWTFKGAVIKKCLLLLLWLFRSSSFSLLRNLLDKLILYSKAFLQFEIC